MQEIQEKRDQMVAVMLSKSELTIVDDWRFDNRISSRGEAIRQLLGLGLEASKHAQEAVQSPRRRRRGA